MKKFITVMLFVSCTPAYSGFFDQIVSEAKKTLEDSLQGTTNGSQDSNSKEASAQPPSAQQTQPKSTTAYKPAYDKSQVKEIQQKLNAMGYEVGAPDGLYGNGTRKGIEAFQKDHGLTVDGKPSTSLLAELNTAEKTHTTTDSESDHTQSSGAFKPETTRELGRAAYIATLHYHPEVLEEEKWLKNAASKLFPEESSSFNKNEFTWQKSKAELKARIQKEIENPPLTLTASWSNNSGGYVAIGKYDFDLKAFEIRLLRIMPTGIGDRRPYVEKLQRAIASQKGLPVAQDIAEKIVQSDARRLYAEYDYTITGAKKYTNKGGTELISDFKLDKIDLYNFSNQKYEYVASINVPDLSSPETETTKTEKKKASTSKVVAQSPAPVKKSPQEPISVKIPEAPEKPVISNPYKRANMGKAFGPDVVDVQLGMSFKEAEQLISKRKQVMKIIDGNPPRPFSAARVFVLQPGDEIIELLALKTAQGDRIASIQRTVYFDPDNSPSQTAITSSVEKKYGTPTYVYEVTGQFNREWYTDAENKLFKSYGSDMRPCQHVVGGSAPDTWLDNGKYYQWTMPWREKTYMGVRASKDIGDGVSVDDNKVFNCGPATSISYSENGGMLIGPSLQIHVYDPAWAVAEFKKSETKQASQGAKGLEL